MLRTRSHSRQKKCHIRVGLQDVTVQIRAVKAIYNHRSLRGTSYRKRNRTRHDQPQAKRTNRSVLRMTVLLMIFDTPEPLNEEEMVEIRRQAGERIGLWRKHALYDTFALLLNCA